MLKFKYIAKLLAKLRISSFNDCKLDDTCKISYECVLSKVRMSRYSYTGSHCVITDAIIGQFCSIGCGVNIGGGVHPTNFVSTSPVFLKGRNFLKKNFSDINYKPSDTVCIGNDVWIGNNSYIKSGITIGNGAIIGAHAVVTKDVEPYTIVAGVPAKKIKMRFDNQTINKLEDMQWWNWSEERLLKYGEYFDDPNKLIKEYFRELTI